MMAKERWECLSCGRRVLFPRNAIWYEPIVNWNHPAARDIGARIGFYCPVCLYELQKRERAILDKPCSRCGEIIPNSYYRDAPLCPSCWQEIAPWAKYYGRISSRGVESPEDRPTLVEFVEFLGAQPKECYWCNTPLDDSFHIDHVIAISRGGKSTLDNLVLSCPGCNSRKANKLPSEWDWLQKMAWQQDRQKVEAVAKLEAERVTTPGGKSSHQKTVEMGKAFADAVLRDGRELFTDKWTPPPPKPKVELSWNKGQKMKIVDLNKLTLDELVQFRPDLAEAARMEA